MDSTTNKDYQFLTEPEDVLKCLLCHKVASNPIQHEECGKLFCKKCIEKHGRYHPCPSCKMAHPEYIKDNKSMKKIGVLSVKCINVERDCQWEGTVGILEEHVGVCEFTLIPCPNRCDTGPTVTRNYLREHLEKTCQNRRDKCVYCGEEGTFAIIQIHQHTCETNYLACTNVGCPVKIERGNMKNHLANECEHTVIPCIYASVGCEAYLKRIDMRAHEQDVKAHLKKAIDTVANLKDAVVQLKDGEARLKDDLERCTSSLSKGGSITFKLTEYTKKKVNNEDFTSPSFYTSHNGYHMAIKVFTNGKGGGKGSHVSVYVQMLPGKYNGELNWPFIGTVTLTLLNQLKDEDHYSRSFKFTQQENMVVSRTHGYIKYIPHSTDPVPDPRYLRNDSLYFKVAVLIPNHKPWLECI